MVSSSTSTRLVLGQVTKCDANPLFGEDYFADPARPWESRFDNVYPTVIYDAEMEKYRAWYFSFSFDGPLQDTPLPDRSRTEYRAGDRQEVLLYAESDDGLAWEKPSLGLIEFGGSSDNNIVMASWTHGIHAGGVLYDPHDPEPGRRYKVLFRSARDRRMAVAFSTDGLDWGPTVVWPANDAVGDTHNNASGLTSWSDTSVSPEVGPNRHTTANEQCFARKATISCTGQSTGRSGSRCEPPRPDLLDADRPCRRRLHRPPSRLPQGRSVPG